jgi:UDP-2-acetamido-3-amino-2,3-dideoxy-glucuronate N-acetyltransferase
MSTTNPKVAVIGCGYWGKNLVRNHHELQSLHAVCDVDERCATELAGKYGVKGYTRGEQVFNDPEIDAVVIAAPAVEHYRLAAAAMRAGKDVYVEKPLALKVEEGEELLEIAEERRRVLMVGHLLQYHPAILELKRMIKTGKFGRVNYIASTRLNFGKLRTEENILWSFAPHDVSAILYLLDEEPAFVSAKGASFLNSDITDVTVTNLEFASGVRGHIFVSWLHPIKEQRLVIVGDRLMAVFDDTQPVKKLMVYSHKVNWIDRVPVADKAEGIEVPIDQVEPLRLECEHFLEAARECKQPRTDGSNGLKVLRILHACEQSMKNGGHQLNPRPVAVPKPNYFVHPTAVVDSPCTIGEGTHIWHFSHVMKNSTLGKKCNLGQNVHVAPGVKVGNNVKIQNNVSLYTGVELEDDVFCGPSMVFTNVVNPRSHIERKNEYKTTLVRRGASLGANSTVVCGIEIGAYAFIAAGAVVTKDVVDFALVMGVPARRVGWMCECGVRLDGQEQQIPWRNGKSNGNGETSAVQSLSCSACQQTYELLPDNLLTKTSTKPATVLVA